MIFTTRLLSHSQIIPHHQSAMCQVLSGRIWSIFGWTNKLSMWYQISYLLLGISCFFCFKKVKIGLSGKSNVIFHSFPKLELSNTFFFPFRRDDVGPWGQAWVWWLLHAKATTYSYIFQNMLDSTVRVLLEEDPEGMLQAAKGMTWRFLGLRKREDMGGLNKGKLVSKHLWSSRKENDLTLGKIGGWCSWGFILLVRGIFAEVSYEPTIGTNPLLTGAKKRILIQTI